jgi:hypothetical protein
MVTVGRQREEQPMKRLISTVIAAVILALALAIPAEAGSPRTVSWICDVPGEGLVTFVSVSQAAAHGIDTANTKAGQVFHDQFGEVCTVVTTS